MRTSGLPRRLLTSQISSLVELRLLSRATNLDKSLGNVKFKCKVDRETVDMLARSVRFNDWATYLTSDDS